MISIESSVHPDPFWNKRLLESKTGTIFQTVENSEYQKIVLNWEHIFLKFLLPNGEIVGQLVLSKTPRQGKVAKFKLGKIFFDENLYRWAYGPVIFNYDHATDMMISLKNYLKINKFKAYGILHPLSSNYFKNLSNIFKVKKWSTFLIDLSLDFDTLNNNLDKHSARKNVDRSLKKNVIVKQITKSELLDYFNLLHHTKEKTGVTIEFFDTETMWSKFDKLGFNIFLAYYEGKPVGGLGVSSFNNFINEWGVGRSEIDFSKKLYAQDLIKWKIIEWGKENKLNYFDLSGVNPIPSNSKEEGIFRYKKKWGGKQVDLLIIQT
jgi:hypothetical protein